MIVAVVPGLGFDRIARELGADETVVTPAEAPSVRELMLAIRKCLADRVLVLPNDPNVVPSAREVARLSGKDAVVAPAVDVPAGLSTLIACGGRTAETPSSPGAFRTPAAAVARERAPRRCSVAARGDRTGSKRRSWRGAPAGLVAGELFTGADLPAVAEEAARRLAQGEDGLLCLYYGGGQKERDAERLAEELRERLPKLDVEWYFGGQRSTEYVVSFER